MVGSFNRPAAALLFCVSLAGCASAPSAFPSLADRHPNTRGARIEQPERPLECVPYARARSGLNLHGDASTWWAAAEGHYARGNQPLLGAVLVLTGYAGPHRGHLAVVTAMDSAREIRVDHANWLDDGQIYRDDPVVDVSPDNDWSEVRVWNPRSNAWGTRTYLVQGFIGPGDAAQQLAMAD